MTTMYYVEVDVTGIDTHAHGDVTQALYSFFLPPLMEDILPKEGNSFAGWTGWMEIHGNATESVHGEIRKAIRTIVPEAHVKTRWLYWDEIPWDAAYDDDNNDTDEDKD